ncbi:uncharacterized protein N7518_009092 [Penicillium psychrosexuale]|uniref:uncharacterized protein n=1 Tax=Penicillium psychrosexuale TaxID=1002107 RepID=UPI002545155A|nr:uncharacterized protein N7518_009092 [Penicillium psychrosexuale]KAJ5783415.1 hypothetical protein N7518_009092 [Penicillium psychrosexuale]
MNPPHYVCYTIAWKLVLNRKTVGKVTEDDLIVAPTNAFALKAQLSPCLRRCIVSVNDKSLKDFEKFYSSTNIGWKPVKKQLRKWRNLLRMGKKIRVLIAFNYSYDDDDQARLSSRRVEKRGRVLATSRMLAEYKAHIDTEEEATGRPSTWSLVYDRMRCVIRSYPLMSDWCWEDPKDKKHNKLRAPYLERLIDHVDEGGSLNDHDDAPSDIRRDLILESQAGKKSKRYQCSPSISRAYFDRRFITSRPVSHESLMIPGTREQAMREYCNWLESRANDEDYKADFRKICQVTLENRLDLELILDGPDAGFFFVQREIQIGTARRFLCDINELHRNITHEPTSGEILDVAG